MHGYKDENEDYEKELKDSLVKLKKMRQKYMDIYTDDLISREELHEKIGGTKAEIEGIVSVRDMTNEQLKQIIQKIEVDKSGNVDIYLRLLGDLGLDKIVLVSDDHT